MRKQEAEEKSFLVFTDLEFIVSFAKSISHPDKKPAVLGVCSCLTLQTCSLQAFYAAWLLESVTV